MKKTFKVVMLPTEKAINDYSLVLLPKNKLQIMSPTDMIDYLDSQSDATKRQELYILSDEEIKEGDWCINIKKDKTFQYNQKIYAIIWAYEKQECEKIEATTDKSIYYKDDIAQDTKDLPQLPESFIQAYIKSYNEGKPITEVDLEMEELPSFGTIPDSYIIKTRPDNTVIVRQSKMYSRGEVVNLFNKYVEDLHNPKTSGFRGFYEWIEDNL